MLRTAIRKFLGLIPSGYRVVRVRRRRVGALGGPKKAYQAHKEVARVIVHQKLAKFNAHYRFAYQRVAIRNQRSRWGSCSKQGNLNFNYRIALLPEHLQDYIIVHELCHLGAFDHSKKFWALVAETIPNHDECRKALVAYARKQKVVMSVPRESETIIELR
ncbi:MAG: M48 family metallopeptidase [Patescibacteria group bacterium]